MSLEFHVKKTLGDFTLDSKLNHQSGVSGILGSSGSGKSLTLQMIAGVVRPDSGHIILNGRVLFDSEKHINLAPQKRNIGYLFQSYALFPTMSVLQNIMCGAPHHLPRQEKKALAQEWIANMRLNGLEASKPGQLSGGQQQRTALARVLIGKPDLLMLDEPFSALDSHLREQLVTELRQVLARFDKDALLVTHNRDEAYELCSTLAVMDKGHIVSCGPTKEVFADPRTRSAAVLTGCKNVVDAKKAGEHLVQVPSWNITLETAMPVQDNLCAIGVRAHYFDTRIQKNSYPVRIVDKVEEPFAWIVKFKYEEQSNDSAPIWWRLPKEYANAMEPSAVRLGVDPKDVLLLYA